MVGLVPVPVVPVLPVRLVPGRGPERGPGPPELEHVHEHLAPPVAGPAPAGVVVRCVRVVPGQSDVVPEKGLMLQLRRGVMLGALPRVLWKALRGVSLEGQPRGMWEVL